MGLLEDVMKTLERIPLWKRLAGVPDQIKILEDRISTLEKRLSAPAGEICRKCREPALIFVSSTPHPVFGDMGVVLDHYRCQKCNYEEDKERSQSL